METVKLKEDLNIRICVSPEFAIAIVRNDDGAREALIHEIVNTVAASLSEKAARIAGIAAEKAADEAEFIEKMGYEPGGICG